MAGMRVLLTHYAPFLKHDPGSFAGWSSRALGAVPKWPRPVVKASRNTGTFNSVKTVSRLNLIAIWIRPKDPTDATQRRSTRARPAEAGPVSSPPSWSLSRRRFAESGNWRLAHAVTFRS
jgi:hypothetical protein